MSWLIISDRVKEKNLILSFLKSYFSQNVYKSGVQSSEQMIGIVNGGNRKYKFVSRAKIGKYQKMRIKTHKSELKTQRLSSSTSHVEKAT